MIYLNDAEGGGSTFFPRAEPVIPMPPAHVLFSDPGVDSNSETPPTARAAGIRVLPREGRALLFFSQMKDGKEDAASMHEAEVVSKGEKWIVTQWCEIPSLREFSPAIFRPSK